MRQNKGGESRNRDGGIIARDYSCTKGAYVRSLDKRSKLLSKSKTNGFDESEAMTVRSGD